MHPEGLALLKDVQITIMLVVSAHENHWLCCVRALYRSGTKPFAPLAHLIA